MQISRRSPDSNVDWICHEAGLSKMLVVTSLSSQEHLVSYLPASPSLEYGIGMDDAEQIAVFATTLAGNWVMTVEYGDDTEPYARLIAPWHEPCSSAFLVERQAGLVVVTDCLSNPQEDIVKTHLGMDDAIKTIRRTILGALTACRGTNERDECPATVIRNP